MTRPAPRPRRSSETVRALVLQASQDLFAERGYEQVSTRDIAERAGVTHAQVFRHFGTKSQLFVEAAYQPFSEFVTDYVGRWASYGHAIDTSAHDTELFVSGLYRLLVDNRRLLVMLADPAAGASPDLPGPPATSLRDAFERLEQEVGVEVQARGDETIDLALAVRFTFALVYGVVAMGDALFPADRWSDHEALAAELAGFVLRGSRTADEPR